MPTVSVIIPTHNRANLLAAAIESVLRQTYRDLEVVVADDASTDNTAVVVAAFRDPRVRYVRHTINRGDAAARNTGVANSTAAYIAFLDDDDKWLPEKLQIQLDVLRAGPPDLGGVHTGRYVVDRETGKVQRVPAPSGRRRQWKIATSTVLLRRQCLEEVGPFDEGNPYSSDFDMWLRILSRYRLEYIDQPLVKAAIHANRLSTNYQKVIGGKEMILRKHSARFVGDSESYSKAFLDLGVFYCYAGDTRKGRRAFARAIRIYPFEIRHYFNLGLSLLGAANFTRVKRWKEGTARSGSSRVREGDSPG